MPNPNDPFEVALSKIHSHLNLGKTDMTKMREILIEFYKDLKNK